MLKRHRQQKRRKQTTKKTSFTFYNFWYDWNVGCFLLHQNLLLNIAHVRRWLHPGCGIGTAPREWEVLRTDTALGILPGCRALMAPMVQRRIEEVRVHKHFLTSCICPAAAAVSASPLEPSCSLLPLCARHPSSVPSGLRTCKHSLKCDTYPLYQQCPINTTCVHAYIGPADTPSHEVNTSLCLCSGQEKVSFKKRTQNFTK